MSSFAVRVAIVGAMLVALAAWSHARSMAPPVDQPDFATHLPLTFAGWIGRDAPPLDPDVARVLAADQYVHRYYGPRTSNPKLRTSNYEPRTTKHGLRIEMDIAYYARPQTGAAMHSPLNCLPGNGWQVIETGRMTVNAAGTPLNVRRLVVDRKGYRVAMTYWFQNRGTVVGNEYLQRFRLLTNGLNGRPTDAALVRVMAQDTEPGRRAIQTFTRDLIVRLNQVFGSN